MRHVRILGVCLVALFAIAAVAGVKCDGISTQKRMEPEVLQELSGQWRGRNRTRGIPNGRPLLLCVDRTERRVLHGREHHGASREAGQAAVRIGRQRRNWCGNLCTCVQRRPVVDTGQGAGSRVNRFRHISPAEQEELGWSTALKESYKQAQKHHASLAKVYEKIEFAGPLAISSHEPPLLRKAPRCRRRLWSGAKTDG